MNTPTRLAAYAAGLAVAFGGAAGIGAAVGPVGAGASGTHGAAGQHDGDAASQAEAGGTPGGLSVSADGYTLAPVSTALTAGKSGQLRFTITGPDGAPVTAYTPEHDKDLHLIVVRRDTTGFQHVHPTLGTDGVWSMPLTLPAAGDHRVFADFVPAAAGARPLTLGVDLHVAGDYQPAPLPTPARTATVDGYTVSLTGDLRAGTSSALTLSVSKDGEPVTDLDPYLAAYGHLVALRAGDLAYLHVHPEGAPGDGRTPAGPGIAFSAEVPTAGTYRLYLDFQHGGVVRTAEFTTTASMSVSSTEVPGADGHTGHTP